MPRLCRCINMLWWFVINGQVNQLTSRLYICTLKLLSNYADYLVELIIVIHISSVYLLLRLFRRYDLDLDEHDLDLDLDRTHERESLLVLKTK